MCSVVAAGAVRNALMLSAERERRRADALKWCAITHDFQRCVIYQSLSALWEKTLVPTPTILAPQTLLKKRLSI